MPSLFDSVDIYCERTGPELLSEPVNAITNLAFIIAALYLAKELRANKIRDIKLWWLTLLVAVIGLGSGLFHTFANNLTQWMDVTPITIFLLSYIWVFSRGVGQQGVVGTTIAILLFLLLGYGTSLVPAELRFNGTISYFPALIYLIAFAHISHKKKLFHTTAYLRLAITIFLFSMTMRSVDMMGCDWLPIGTHFLWHIANGLVLYFVVKALIKQQVRAG